MAMAAVDTATVAAEEQAADLETVVAVAALDMVPTGLVPVAATAQAAVLDLAAAAVATARATEQGVLAPVPGMAEDRAREKQQDRADMATVERAVVLATLELGVYPAEEQSRAEADMAATAATDITAENRLKYSEEFLLATASRVRVLTVFACQDRSLPFTVRKAELARTHRPVQERGTLSEVMEPERLWNRTLLDFGLTRTARNNFQANDRHRERELVEERPSTEQISEAKAARAISEPGISWAAAKPVLRWTPMREAFGSTKRARRHPARSSKV
jgi:hypothetical protein